MIFVHFLKSAHLQINSFFLSFQLVIRAFAQKFYRFSLIIHVFSALSNKKISCIFITDYLFSLNKRLSDFLCVPFTTIYLFCDLYTTYHKIITI